MFIRSSYTYSISVTLGFELKLKTRGSSLCFKLRYEEILKIRQ